MGIRDVDELKLRLGGIGFQKLEKHVRELYQSEVVRRIVRRTTLWKRSKPAKRDPLRGFESLLQQDVTRAVRGLMFLFLLTLTTYSMFAH
jgi:hypothetical protein